MEITTLDVTDDARVGEVIALVNAVLDTDAPENPRLNERSYRAELREPRPGMDTAHFTALADGKVVGYLGVATPTKENLHLAMAELLVHPGHRRRGHGTAMLDHYLDFARGKGRTDIVLGTLSRWEQGPDRPRHGAAFLEHHGFAPALVNVNRRCRVDALTPEAEQRFWTEATAASEPDYLVRTWTGPAPDDLLSSLCRLDSKVLTEIPMGDIEVEGEQVDPERRRAKEAARAAVHELPIVAAAVHRATGEVAAYSAVYAYTDPDARHAWQGITIVDPAHRGHRLGLLVKLANLRQLREARPAVREIWTNNADVNEHMIAINERLGYETVDAQSVYLRKLDA